MPVSILPLEVLSLDDVLASGRGDKNAATFDGIFDGRHLVALHRGLKSVDGVDLGDDARRRIEECDDRRRGNDWYPRRDDRSSNRQGRYGNYHEPEEPEWMSASINQGELMELHGFDDSPEKEVSKKKNLPTEEPKKKGKDLWMDGLFCHSEVEFYP